MGRLVRRSCRVHLRWSVVVLGLLAALPAAKPAVAQETATVAISVGLFDIANSDRPLEAGVELRLPIRYYALQVATGLAVTEDGNGYVFGGLARDFRLADRWFVTPGFGIAIYEKGDGKDLGGPLEFRSALELSYRRSDRSRLGVAVYHVSNAGIYDLNPGANSAIVSYGYSFGR